MQTANQSTRRPRSTYQRQRLRIERLTSQLLEQKRENLSHRQETKALKAELNTLNIERTAMSSTHLSQQKAFADIRELKKTVQDQERLIKDLTFNLAKTQEHNIKLKDENENLGSFLAEARKHIHKHDDEVESIRAYLIKVQEHNQNLKDEVENNRCEKEKLLACHQKQLNETTYNAHRQNVLLQDQLQKAASEKEDLSKKYQEALNELVKDTTMQINLHQDKTGNLKSESEKLASLHKSISHAWNHIHRTHFIPWARKKAIAYDSDCLTSIDNALTIMVQDATDVDSLRANCQFAKNQIKSLQTQLLAHVKKVRVIPDEQLMQEFRNLASSIKNFSRMNFPLSKAKDVRTCGVVMGSLLLKGVNSTLWTSPIRKKSIVEAFIWSVLYQSLFANPCKFFFP